MKCTLAITAICIATMLFAIDISIVNTTLPAIQTAFDATYLDLRWIIDIFLIFLASLLIPCGIIGDKLLEHRVLYTGLIIFFIGCSVSGFADNLNMLLVGRAFEGIAMATLFPTSLAVITHLFKPEEKTKAISIWSMSGGIGLAIGPVLGGLIVSFTSWRWIFLFNLPLIIISIALAAISLPKTEKMVTKLRLRWHSVMLFTAAVAAIITAVLEEPNWSYHSPLIYGLLIAGLILMWLFYLIEHNKPDPLLDFRLFKHSVYVKASAVTFNCGFFLYSMLYLAPLYLHDVLFYKSYKLGLLMLPISASLVISSRLVPQLTRVVPLKCLLICAVIMLIVGDLMQLHFGLNRSPYYIITTFIIIGFAWGVTYAGSTSYALSVIPDHTIHTASSVFMTIRNFGGGLGLALSGTVFYHFRNATKHGSLLQYSTTTQLKQHSFLHGFYAANILLAAFLLVSLCFLLARQRPPLPSNIKQKAD